MRKIISLAVVASLALALTPGAATAQKKKKKRPPPYVQEEEGSILMPAPWTDDSGCFAGGHRRGFMVTQGNNNGLIGAHFEVDERTWKRNFVLEPTGGSGHVDLDIYFYLDDFGGPENALEDPVNWVPPPSVSFNTREAGGEADKVPENAKHVIVCMYGGPTGGAGFNASFEYRAGTGVKLPEK